MKKLPLVLMTLLISTTSTVYAGASGHAGHTAGSSGSASSCMKAHFSRFSPPNLTEVAPGTEFSFVVENAQKTQQIKAVVKGQPVQLSFEDKETFFVAKGQLPADLKNTVARISVKVESPITRCDAENGWLVKIGE